MSVPAETRSKPLVLVIDDHVWIRSIVIELLESNGFSGVLQKPFDLADLLARVRDAAAA